MDKMEKALSEVIKQEENRIKNAITCFITYKPCKKCQPYCTHRQREESKGD